MTDQPRSRDDHTTATAVMLRDAWGGLAAEDDERARIALGGVAVRLTDLAQDYGVRPRAWRHEAGMTNVAAVVCVCGDEHQMWITDETRQRQQWERVLDDLGKLTGVVRDCVAHTAEGS